MNKQIEEMARTIFESRVAIDGIDIAFAGVHGADREDSHFMRIAGHLHRNGYRKASEVAEEIFAEIANIIRYHDELAERDGSEYGELIVSDIGCALGELKKKYTEVQGDGT